jgi:hypothetical protein
MSVYTVKKAFERFHPGDELNFNARQAKYLLMSGHIAAAEEMAEKIKTPKLELEFIPEAETETKPEQENESSAAAKKKTKKHE